MCALTCVAFRRGAVRHHNATHRIRCERTFTGTATTVAKYGMITVYLWQSVIRAVYCTIYVLSV